MVVNLWGVENFTNNYADSYDLILAAKNRGLAHPPGYQWLTWILTALPMKFELQVLGANVMNGLMMSVAEIMIGLSLYRMVKEDKKNLDTKMMAVVGTTVFFISQSVDWQRYAKTVEVFPLAILLTSLAVWCLLHHEKKSGGKSLGIGFITGMGIWYHPITAIILLGLVGCKYKEYGRGHRLVVAGGIGLALVITILSLGKVSRLAEYSWPAPLTLRAKWDFYWRLVYDPKGSAIETLTFEADWQARTLSIGRAMERWLADRGSMYGLVFLIGMGTGYWDSKRNSGKLWRLIWLIYMVVVPGYLTYPGKDLGETAFFWGGELRQRMLFVLPLIEAFILIDGIRVGLGWWQKLEGHRWRLGGAMVALLLVEKNFEWRRIELDYDGDLAVCVLSTLPKQAKLIVDTDFVFSLLKKQQLDKLRPDIWIIPARMNLTNSGSRLAQQFISRYGYTDSDQAITKLIAYLLAKEDDLYLFGFEPRTLNLVGVEGNPFFISPAGYTLKIGRQPSVTYGQYQTSMAETWLMETNGEDWWAAGYRSYLAGLNLEQMYFYGINGYFEVARDRLERAKRLYFWEESRWQAGQLFDLVANKYRDQGKIENYIVMSQNDWLDKARVAKTDEEKEYAISRAILSDFFAIEPRQEYIQYLKDANRVSEAVTESLRLREMETEKVILESRYSVGGH